MNLINGGMDKKEAIKIVSKERDILRRKYIKLL